MDFTQFKQYLLTFLSVLFDVLNVVIFLRVLISWLPIAKGGALVKFLRDITEPMFSFVRKFISPIGGVLDLAPLVVWFGIDIVRALLFSLIANT